MGISVFGIIWLALIIYCFPNRKRMFYLLMLSTVMQASYVIIIVGTDLNAMIITSLTFLVREIWERKKINIPKKWSIMLIYSIYLLLISIIAPIVFSGHTFIGMTNSEYDFHLTHIETVKFSINNITQPLAIILYTLVAFALYRNKEYYSLEMIKKNVIKVFWIVVVIGMIHEMILLLGLPTNIYEILLHNEKDIIGSTFVDKYTLGKIGKFMSTFYEASYCGSYLSIMLAFFLFEDRCKGRYKLILTCCLCLLLNMSSTGLMSALFATFVFLIYRIKKGSAKISYFINFMVFLVTICAVLITFPSIRNMIFELTFNKINSGAFAIRTFIDKNAVREFLYTNGLGMGLGSIQCYSVWATLLSQTGLIGTVLYVLMNGKFIRNLNRSTEQICQGVKVMLYVAIFSQLLSIQALNYCVYWECLWIIILILERKSNSYG